MERGHLKIFKFIKLYAKQYIYTLNASFKNSFYIEKNLSHYNNIRKSVLKGVIVGVNIPFAIEIIPMT